MRYLLAAFTLFTGSAWADNMPYSNSPLPPLAGSVPVASSGVTPTTCTGATKGQQYVTAAGNLCYCNGTTFLNQSSFSVNVSIVNGLGTASATTCIF